MAEGKGPEMSTGTELLVIDCPKLAVLVRAPALGPLGGGNYTSVGRACRKRGYGRDTCDANRRRAIGGRAISEGSPS